MSKNAYEFWKEWGGSFKDASATRQVKRIAVPFAEAYHSQAISRERIHEIAEECEGSRWETIEAILSRELAVK